MKNVFHKLFYEVANNNIYAIKADLKGAVNIDWTSLKAQVDK